MFVQASWEAVTETVFAKYYHKIIPWEKRLCWREIKGYLISVSFNASMSNYSRGDWRQANLYRPHVCLGIRCNIREHGWLVRKTGAVGEQNNNDEETWKETFRGGWWGRILCLWFHSVERTFGSWVIFKTWEFPAAHMPASRQLARCPPRPSMLLLSNQYWKKHGPQTERETPRKKKGASLKSIVNLQANSLMPVDPKTKADHSIHTPDGTTFKHTSAHFHWNLALTIRPSDISFFSPHLLKLPSPLGSHTFMLRWEGQMKSRGN